MANNFKSHKVMHKQVMTQDWLAQALSLIFSFVKQKTIIRLWLCLVLTTSFGICAVAQTRSDGATPKMTQPGAPAGSYSLSGFESVNLFNGNLNFNLQLAKVGGRGKAAASINLAIDSARWEVEIDPSSWSTVSTPLGGGYQDMMVFSVTRCYENWNCEYYPNYRICTFIDRTCTTEQINYFNNLAVMPSVPMNGPNHYGLNYIIRENTRDFSPGYSPGVLERRPGRIGGSFNMVSGVEEFWSLDRLYFISPDGTEYELRDELTGGRPNLGTYSQNYNRGTVFKSFNGDGLRFVSDSPIIDFHSQSQPTYPAQPSGILQFPDGSKYRIDTGKVSWIRDVDGNQMTYTYTTNQMTITDSLNRQVVVTYNIPSSEPETVYDSISSQISATEWQTVKVYRTTLGNALRGDFQLMTYPQMFPEISQFPSTGIYNPNNKVVKRVELPDGRSYKLFYTSYNEIARVELPTGSAIEYDFPMPIANPPQNWSGTVFRPIKERRVYENGGSIITNSPYHSKQKYIREATGSSKVTVEEYSGNVGGEPSEMSGKSSHYFYGLANSIEQQFYGDWKNGREFKTETFDKNGMLRQKTETEWENFGTTSWGDTLVGNKVRVKNVTSTAFENGQSLTSKTVNGYDNDSITNNKTDVWIYDYGTNGSAGRLLKHTQTSYLKVNPANGLDYTSNAIYLHGLPVSSKLFDVKPDETGELVSHSETKYDEPNYPVLTYSGGVTGWIDPNTTARGNATTARTWLREENRWLETHAQFDQFGNPRKSWDTSGDSSRFVETEYSADYQYAYPTRVIAPAPDPNNTGHGTNQTSQATTVYNFYTGLPVSVTDDFGQTTTTEYNDVLLRPKRIIPPAGAGQTIFEYGDTVGNLYVKVKKQIDEQNWSEATEYFDGLGRTIRTQAKDAAGDVFVETQYDSLGRVKKVTNPYRNGETKYWTETEYDEIGRVKKVYSPTIAGQTPQSYAATAYGISTVPNFVGTYVVSTDQAGKKARAITNALGQLIRVDEATAAGGTVDADLGTLASPHQPTFYSYNARGKMVKVVQGGQSRYFLYDNLGRLQRVRQPEQDVNGTLETTGNPDNNQWTAGFSYDDLGNVLTATDAKGVVITTSYDHHNRVKTRTYTVPSTTDPKKITATTPNVSYFYDGKGLPSIPQYAKGKLTKVTSSISETCYTEFDHLGRVLQSEQETDGQTYRMGYSYNLSGALVSQRYPSGRIVRNEFNADGDFAKVLSLKGGAGRTFASNFSYNPSGSVKSMLLGNGKWETAEFNNNLQLVQLGLGTSATDMSLWKVNLDYGELSADGTSVDATKNNGNIARQKITVQGLAQPFVQTYRFDSLQRLTEARETFGTQQTSEQTWKQTFGYDRFGNRTNFSQIVGTNQLQLNSQTHPTINANTNRFNDGQGYHYDFNGNLIQDAESRKFVFNADNKQVEVKSLDAYGNVTGVIGKYFYDGEGKRVKKVTGLGEVTLFVYDAAGRLVAEYDNNFGASQQPPQTSYTTADHLNSPRVITNQSGDVTSRRDFMPFGEELNAGTPNRTEAQKYGLTGADNLRKRFTGYEKDTETGLDFAEARYYQNKHGRFTAVDPLLASGKSSNPQTFNRYVYVMNRPLIMTDPSGLDANNPWYRRLGEDGLLEYQWFSSLPIGFGNRWEKVTEDDFVFNSTNMGRVALDPFSSKYISHCETSGQCGAFTKSIELYKTINFFNGMSETYSLGFGYYFRKTWESAGLNASFVNENTTSYKGGSGASAISQGTALRIGLAGAFAPPTAQEAATQAAANRRAQGGQLPTATTAVVDQTTGKVYINFSGKPHPTQTDPQMQRRVDFLNATGGSREKWCIINCAEFKGVNDALLNRSRLENLDVHTVRTKSGNPMCRCGNCQVTCQGVNVTSDH